MRILIAFDKFKDALTAPAACAAAAAALRSKHPDWTLTQCPLTDGGEGFAAILTQATGGRWQSVRVTGPRGQPLETGFGLVPLANISAAARRLLQLPEGLDPRIPVALIEMATASGLALLKPDERDPWQTTSLGTGELIKQAVATGAGALLLGVGGSATHDLGLGALAALGLTFIGRDDHVVTNPIPAAWPQVTRIAGRLADHLPPIRIACDVANPLLGSDGAAAVYGPQKGLKPTDRPKLEAESERLATLLCAYAEQSPELMTQRGAGAAGGIAFGLMAAAGAKLLPGSALVAAWLDLDRHVREAELVITGEGTFDESSLSGKGPGSLATQALAQGKPVHVFAGRVSLSRPPAANLHLHAITPTGMPLTEALLAAPHLLAATVRATF